MSDSDIDEPKRVHADYTESQCADTK